jgi:Tol biopolymer transport system component
MRVAPARVGIVVAVICSACAGRAPDPPTASDVPTGPPQAEPGPGGGATDSGTIVTPTDGGTGNDDASVLTPACDTSKPFSAPTRLAGAWDPNTWYSTPRLSSDELTIYYTTVVAGVAKMGHATRATPAAAFGPPSLITAEESAANDNDPSVGADQLSLWFQSTRSGAQHIYTATRASTSVDFGAPSLIPVVNSAASEAHAYFRKSGSELWFISTRGDAANHYHIYMSRMTGTTFAAPLPIAELNSPSNDFAPQPSEDGLTLLMTSDRAGGKGSFDLYLARRASTALPWSAPEPIAELNTANFESGGWLSDDGCRITFSSDRDAPTVRHSLWYAERPK